VTAVFIDTAILMYAGGGPHPLQAPSQQIVGMIRDGELDGVISAEVVQEILHRFVAIRRNDIGARMARDALDLFAPVLPLTHAVMDRLPDLVARYPSLTARDLVHVATCLEEGLAAIVSPDRGLDAVREIVRISPDDADSLGGFLTRS
jgi:predicted nucleic acid-binding protein